VLTAQSRCRFGYINWLWYGWGAVMINQYKDTDLKIYGDQSVLEYYSLNGISEWAFLGYSSLTFVFFFMVAYIVSPLMTCSVLTTVFSTLVAFTVIPCLLD